MTPDSAPHPTDVRAGSPAVAAALAAALSAAVASAGLAPSIHNTQPWQWRMTGDSLDLHLEPSRLLDVADPDARLATLSCGAALHHARVSLAAQGWRATVTRIPDPAHPEHLAHLQADGPARVDPPTVRRAQAIRLRHTDRRPLSGPRIGPDELRAITRAVQAEGTSLHVLSRDQVIDLATAADHAHHTELHEARWQAELAYWTGGTRPTGTGIPDTAIPARPPQTTVPGRDFGHHGDLPIGDGHDRTATFAILYGHADQPLDWLHAGEALSAAWLTATEIGASLLPLSATIEMISTRQAMRVLLSSVGYPHLVLRLGTVNPNDARPDHAPRLPTDQIIDSS
ncbi:Acg family FMN-binding oxidoreductase [Virgisporangium aurantiacum]|uniref:NAD(P)H nitroreductase n=1 Tax=Virgisporangium aurantiacum TaxID=175570 RepID=A0A8J3ZA88_9ACTN|nr:nitroreductase [Virgisporangium aurantiacum]GIJ60269.1 NAD(P)H nitroreductase [Virgisporangium aurantiacum]